MPGRTALDPAAVAAGLAGVVPGRVVLVERTASTSSALTDAVRREPEEWPDRSVLVADHQEAGRGRAGRTWTTPARAALTASVLLRPDVPGERLGWLPLLTGLAVVRAVRGSGVEAVLKWPNDVLVPSPDGSVLDGWGTRRKVAGVLAEVVTTADHPAVVVGIGINVSQDEAELPVPSAISLAGAGAAVDRLTLLVDLLTELVALDERWRAGDLSVVSEVSAVCSTLGSGVRVELPGGGRLEGTATGLAPDGALVVTGPDGARHQVLAGDVHHLRGS